MMTMLHHNLLIAWRNFRRHRGSFYINLLGLSSGLTSALFIYLWVNDELRMDRFHENGARLYQVLTHVASGDNEVRTSENNSDLLAPAMREELPGVEYVVPVTSRPSPGILTFDEKSVKASGTFAGQDFFDVFSFRLVHGDRSSVLKDRYAIVISEELSARLFGTSENVVGKAVTFSEARYGDSYIVSGVFERKSNSSERFDFLLTNEMFLFKRPPSNIGWHSNSSRVFVVLAQGVDPKEFSEKLGALYRSKLEPMYGKDHPEWIGNMFMEKYTDRYLYGRWENGIRAGGRIDYVMLFSIVGLFVLAIACINFMNLSTARASRRLKEIGIKKAVGARRTALASQYVSESLLLSFFALLISVGLVALFLPEFNLITGKQLKIGWNTELIIGALSITLLTGIVSGSYPAFYLSGIRTVEVLKGRIGKSISGLVVRKGLVIFQFSISILFIVSVMVIYFQIDYIQSKDPGYEREGVISFDIEGDLNSNYATFVFESRKIPGVVNATYMQGSPTNFNNTSAGHTWQGQRPGGNEISFKHAHVGYDFIETLGIELKDGRSFSPDFAGEENKIILNEAAVEAMGLIEPIGKKVNIREPEMEIIGVVRDFHIQSFYEEIQPLALLFKTAAISTVLIRIEPRNVRETISSIGDLYHQFNPGVPFDFRFIDDEYQALYVAEGRVATLSRYFAVVTVIISCLGLFGLAAFSAERRTREIGIRKILGASELGIVRMLSADFISMVVMAIVIAIPLSYYLADSWLSKFAYRVDLELWYFAAAGLIALLVAWLTVGIQTFMAARINPTECIRNE